MRLKRKSEKLEIVTKGLICQSFYAYRTKESILQKLGSRDIWKIANSFFNKGQSVTTQFNDPDLLSSAC